MSLRKHQSDFKAVIDRIIKGDSARTIYCQVCPGGGKSILPIMAGQLIAAGLADKLLWIAPRLSLTVYFGKPRAQMTIRELERCLKHVQQTYPLSVIRGIGRRVSANAEPINCVWR